MNIKFLLGVATGVGVTLFLTSPTGKRWIASLGKNVDDLLNKGEDLLIDATDGLEVVREKVVKATEY